MKVLSYDLVTNGDISNSEDISTAPGHPIENIQDTRLSHSAWIAASGYDANMYNLSMYNQNYNLDLRESGGAIIDIDLGAVHDFDTFCLAGNNFKNINYTITWSVNDINTPDGTITYLKTEPEWTSFIPFSLSSVTGRYVRLVIADANQTGSWLQIGRISIGQSVDLPAIAPTYDVEYVSNANRSLSSTRQLYGGPVVIYKNVNIRYPLIEDKLVLETFFRTVDLYNPFYVQFDNDCPMPEEAMYSSVGANSLPFNYNEAGIFTSQIQFTEVF